MADGITGAAGVVNDVRAAAQLKGLSGEAITLAPVYPEWLGDAAFTGTHGCRFPYVVGEMARGIATPRMVIAAVEAGFMGFYGSAGLRPDTVADGLSEITAELGPDAAAWGANLIHSPQQPGQERAIVDLFLARGVARVSASAFMALSPEIVRYSASGLSRAADGSVQRSTHVFAKVSRAEVAERFMAPAPEKILRALVAAGDITDEQALLAANVPVACDITAEADSGGHTDNRPAATLLPSLIAARARVCAQHGLAPESIRIGLAGGIGTPHAAASAFQMGAAYVLTGSINQSAVESGLSAEGRALLAKAGPADVIMAPAADMFEQGVKVQVLKRGTLFGPRGNRLAEIHRRGLGFQDLPERDRDFIETVLGEPFAEAWAKTADFMAEANPGELERAMADPVKQLALVIRRYLFFGAQWAREGIAARTSDFQIWCGPAMGAFNEWVAGSHLAPVENRTVAEIGWNIMEGAARLIRAQQARAMGLALPAEAFNIRPEIISAELAA
jgi:trans-AT polyketide synthase, acyltransferase and oxidoreductase domains